MSSRTLRDTIWGVRIGLAFGAFWSVVAVGLRPFASPPDDSISIQSLVVLYLLGGVAAGATVGVLRRFTTGMFGRAIVGTLAAWPVALLMVVFALESQFRMNAGTIAIVTMLALIWGILGAVMLPRIFKSDG